MNEQALILATLEKDPSERAAFRDEACGDAALRRGLETLLRLHTEPHSLLNVPAAPGPANGAAEPPAEPLVEAVARRLKEVNPRFGGPVTLAIRDGVITGLRDRPDAAAGDAPDDAAADVSLRAGRRDRPLVDDVAEHRRQPARRPEK
jgi:hypothetical protein